jgi:hypothetical protein
MEREEMEMTEKRNIHKGSNEATEMNVFQRSTWLPQRGGRRREPGGHMTRTTIAGVM